MDRVCSFNGIYKVYNLVLVILGQVKENVHANHVSFWMLSKCLEFEISTRAGMLSLLVVIIMSGRSDEMSLKSISS